MSGGRRIATWGLGGLAVLLVAAQAVPYGEATNPPVESEVAAPAEVRSILERACYDCHSNETVWPWYSQVAPAKWLVRRDVAEGREHLNLSTWNRLDAEDRAHALEEIVEVMEEGEMPLAVYTPLHPEARLTDAERQRIMDWARTHPDAAPTGEFREEGRERGD